MRKTARICSAALLLFLFALMLSACGYTLGERLEMAELERTAEKNAVAYIKEKYGFTPSVVSAACATYDSSPVPNLSPSPTGYVYVEVRKDQEKDTFWVYATGENKNTRECWDNFQHAEIEDAVKRRMETLLGAEIRHIDLFYGKFAVSSEGVRKNSVKAREFALIHDYFDGSNFSEALGNAVYYDMVVCTADTDYLPDLSGKAFAGVFGENMDCLILNYKSADAYDAAHSGGCAVKAEIRSIGDAYVYLKDQYYITAAQSGEAPSAEYRRYELKQYEDFYYIAAGGTYCNFENAEEEIAPASAWNGSRFSDARKVYGAYKIDSDAECVYLFIPASSLEVSPVTDRGKIRVGKQRYHRDSVTGIWEPQYDTASTDWINDRAILEHLFNSEETGEYLTATIYLYEVYRDTIFSVFADGET